MAANRYGQIWHGDHHHINIRFPSTEARLKFQDEFEAYHASHDHEGDIPTFKCVSSKDLKLSTGSRSPEDLVKAETDENYRITVDGYGWSDIHSYHNPSGLSDYTWYRVPTCCVPPIIVVDRAFVDSGTLQRHPLSAIFGDMPDTDFQSLLDSVQADGFIDPIIRIYEGQILDGWHRYRAARELNLIRRLKFQDWNEDDRKDGDPKVFVFARNIERRHLTPGQRAQIAVTFNERFGYGGDRSKGTNVHLKSQEELAQEVNVSKKTIQRAVKVETIGQSQAVIAGEKTAGEVITEETLKNLWEQVSEEMKAWKERNTGVSYASKTMLVTAYREHTESEQVGVATVEELKGIIKLMDEDSKSYVLRVRYLRSDLRKEFEDAQTAYFKARADIEAILEEKEASIEDFYTNATVRYGLQGMRIFHSAVDIRRNRTLTIEIFKHWYEVLETIHTDLENDDSWLSVPDSTPEEPGQSDADDTLESEDADSDVSTSEASKDREASKLLKQKKQALKSMWDKRKQAHKDWLGESDTDLNQYLCLTDLEKGFAEYEGHDYCADAFRSAFQRTSEPSFNIVVEKALEADVSLEVLQEEARVMDTYAYDVLQWEKQGWIQQLIAKKKGVQSESPITESEEAVPDKQGLSKEFKRIFTLHNRFDPSLVDCRTLGETYHLHEEDVTESMEIFQRELGALEKKVRTESSSDISVEDIADRVEVDDIEVVRAMVAKIQLNETNQPSTPSAPEENLPLQNALDEMKVDTETFDWNSVRPDFDPEKHEWLQVVIQRGDNHTTVTKIPMGPARFSYGSPETEVVIAKGRFSVKEITEFAAELSEIFAKWVAGKSE